MLRYTCGTHAMGFERAGQEISIPPPPTCRGIGAAEPRPTAWAGARRALAHITITPRPSCAARAPQTVGRISTGRNLRGPCDTGFERAGCYLPRAVLPTCRGVGAVELRPTPWGWSAPRVVPQQPRRVRAARRVLRGPSAATPWCDTRPRERAPRNLNMLAKNFRPPRRQVVAVLVRLSLGRRRREQRTAR